MPTEFKLLFEGEPDLEIDKFQQSLPPTFHVTEKSDGIYVTLKSELTEDPQCQYLIDREIDRHFFLTCVKIRAEMVRSTVTEALPFSYRIHGSLPDGISPQTWNCKLPIQLRLWSITADIIDFRVKILFLFQIIEFERPNYPKYWDSTKAPDPLTECKFVRHLVVHSGEVLSSDLKRYCAYLGLPEVMLDITNPRYCEIIAAKVTLMKTEAKKIIERALLPVNEPDR